MTGEEIMQLFRERDYTDPIGHPLTMNVDFVHLVNRSATVKNAVYVKPVWITEDDAPNTDP